MKYFCCFIVSLRFAVRNPKDVAVSFYYHTIGFEEYYHFSDGSFDEFFEIFLSGKCDSGDYFKLASEWYEESKKRSNVYLMLYEDMKNDIRGYDTFLYAYKNELWF